MSELTTVLSETPCCGRRVVFRIGDTSRQEHVQRRCKDSGRTWTFVVDLDVLSERERSFSVKATPRGIAPVHHAGEDMREPEWVDANSTESVWRYRQRIRAQR